MRDWRDNYSHLLFCGGGSGVAPLMAMVSELLRLHAERRLPHVQSVHLIWVRTKIACELVEHIQMGIIASFDEKITAGTGFLRFPTCFSTKTNPTLIYLYFSGRLQH